MSEVNSFQSITVPKDNNPSITSVTRKVQQSSLIIAVAVSLVGLAWKLFKLPISIFNGSLGLVTGSVRLSFWVAGSVLSFWLSFLGLNRSRRNPKPSSIPPVSVSVSAAAEEPDAVDFLSEFESRYGKLHPNFVSGDFMDAVERSRREYKLLFVYLHSPDHPDTPSFCKDTLCSEVLSAFVNENFVAWGESIREKQGLDISNRLNASRFPFWAVIETATGESFSMLRQFEGPLLPEEMVTELQSVLQDNSPVLVAGKLDTDEDTNNTSLMEEQDAALEAEQMSEDQNEIETEAESEAKLYEEEASPLVAEPEQGPDVIQVFVRLPTGERIGTGLPVTATLQSVYDFVDSSGCLDIGSYTLVTFFPRVLYGQDQLVLTLEELQVHPLTSLFVELNS